MSAIHDLIIIGGGPGGLTAGIYAMRAALNTVLVEKGPAGGQVMLSDEVENWPGTEKTSGAELSQRFAQHAAAYGLPVVNREVAAIEPGLDLHEVLLDDGARLQAHAVIMAMGGSPRKLGIPGEKEYYGKGVSYCAVCDGFFFRNKTVAVIGGGDSAVEEGLYLAKLAQKVYIVHRRDALRASRILQQRLAAECKMAVVWNSVPAAIHADLFAGVNALDLQDVKTGEKRRLAVDGVFVFIGFNPNNALVPAGVKLNAQGYVITDDRCATATPGIYAIGDLREKFARQIVTAAADGATAALAAAHYVEAKKAGDATCALPA
jgi:thioredoxin reductase (NADPH)